MKSYLTKVGCISATTVFLFSCIGCASLAEQMVSSDVETRWAAARTYEKLPAAEQATVQKELLQMVYTAEDVEIRKAAVEQVKDQAELVKIARRSSDDDVRKSAVWSLKDPQVLIEIAQKDRASDVRRYAVAKIEDQKVLAEIAKTDSDVFVRARAIEKLTDQKVLAKIAKTDSDMFVRETAIEKLTDQTALAEVVKAQEEGIQAERVCEKAFLKLTDQKLLADVAKSDKGDFRKKAVEKLRDQQVIGDVAMNAKSDGIRELAANKLDDSHPIKQKYYATYAKTYDGIFLNVPHVPIYDAVTKLTDQKLLADVAKNAKNTEVSARVAKKLVEQDLLFDVAMNSKHGMAAEITASKLKNQKQIIEVLKKSKSRGARLAVVKKVKDINVLKTVVKTTRNDKELSGEIAGQINTLNCFDSSTSFEQIKFDKPFTATSGNVASGNYRLTKNVELTSSIRVAAGNVVRIDLANFSIGGADIIVSKGARLELFNGKIKRTLEHDDLNALVGRAECQIRNEGFLVLENTEVKIRIKNNLGSLRLMEFNFLMTGGTFDTSDKTTIDLTHGYLWGHIVQNGKFIPLSEGQILFKAEGKKVDDVVVVGALPGKFVARLPRGYFVEERPSKIEGLVDLVIVRE
ncbi:MAG: HEAT repeat domain-containing protein [Kiritimatiellae bacterium]|nr:HEAT repeat domain-containing protein [Kiritimatiellia bacterium]